MASSSTAVAGLGIRDLSSSPASASDKIRISKIGGRYLVFDVADVARLRRQHSMCAVLVGITPQAPNQSVFSSLPLELTADEVRWLVYDRKAAYVADDWQAHLASLARPAARRAYMESVVRQRKAAQAAADEVAAERERRGAELRASMGAKRAERKSKKAAGKAGGATVSSSSSSSSSDKRPLEDEEVVSPSAEDNKAPSEEVEPAVPESKETTARKITTAAATDRANDDADAEPLLVPPLRIEEVMLQEDALIFGGRVEEERMKAVRGPEEETTPKTQQQKKAAAQPEKKPLGGQPLVSITPTTSEGLVGGEGVAREEGGGAPLIAPSSSSSAALRAHLAERGYYTTPGLRFGGALSVYPGDPFRYHAHFVATSYEWDEPIALLDLIGTGRLATGVKKGLLIGGAKLREMTGEEDEEDGGNANNVRTFTLEWGAM